MIITFICFSQKGMLPSRSEKRSRGTMPSSNTK